MRLLFISISNLIWKQIVLTQIFIRVSFSIVILQFYLLLLSVKECVMVWNPQGNGKAFLSLCIFSFSVSTHASILPLLNMILLCIMWISLLIHNCYCLNLNNTLSHERVQNTFSTLNYLQIHPCFNFVMGRDV
jgi:hypothetical protein